MNIWRSILGVVVGLIVWSIVFYALAFGLAAVWHDYGLHGREFFRSGAFTFTSPMAACNLVFWALAEVAAGWVTMKIARRREAVWVIAGLLVVYLGCVHLVLYWPRFPWWYNLGVVIPAVFAVLLGGRLAGAKPAVT
jgi:hypothetical protein